MNFVKIISFFMIWVMCFSAFCLVIPEEVNALPEGETSAQTKNIFVNVTYVTQSVPDTNYGSDSATYISGSVGAKNSNIVYANSIWDYIPLGSVITTATLYMYQVMYGTTTFNTDIYTMESSTDEASVTWNNMGAHNATKEIRVPVSTANSVWKTFNLTSSLNNVSNGDHANFGWYMEHYENDVGSRRFTSDDGTPANRPYIAVTYLLPEAILTANFVVNDDTVSVGDTVTFTDLSTRYFPLLNDIVYFGPYLDTEDFEGSAYNWNFDDVNEATTVNATHSWNDPGVYHVVLTITDGVYADIYQVNITVTVDEGGGGGDYGDINTTQMDYLILGLIMAILSIAAAFLNREYQFYPMIFVVAMSVNIALLIYVGAYPEYWYVVPALLLSVAIYASYIGGAYE